MEVEGGEEMEGLGWISRGFWCQVGGEALDKLGDNLWETKEGKEDMEELVEKVVDIINAQNSG